LAEESIQLRTLYQMIISAPRDAQQVSSSDWQKKSYLFGLVCRAEQKASRHPEWELIRNYFLIERPNLASKTRETIDADFTGMFDPLTRGKIGELFGTSTNLTPDDIFNGKVIVVDLAVARHREIGQYAALIWSQLSSGRLTGAIIMRRRAGQCFCGLMKRRNSRLNKMLSFRRRRAAKVFPLFDSAKMFRISWMRTVGTERQRSTRCLVIT
jgi:hypothetical protein